MQMRPEPTALVADLAPGALGAIFDAPEPVTLAIERAGARIELAVTPRER